MFDYSNTSIDLRSEFEVSEKTGYSFYGPPDVFLGHKTAWWRGSSDSCYDGSEYVDVSNMPIIRKGTSKWTNHYGSGQKDVQRKIDRDNVLLWNWNLWNYKSEAYTDDVIEVHGEGIKDPDRIEVVCWDEKYIGDSSAYDKSEKVEVSGASFKPKKGAYIYQIQAFWDDTAANDGVSVSGSVYFGTYIDAKVDRREPLTLEQGTKLFNDYIQYTKAYRRGAYPDDFYIADYRGTFNGCEVVVIYEKYMNATSDIQSVYIAGYKISLASGSYTLLLHKDGTFIPIETAYKKGYLSKSDIRKIAGR